jgi:hypothetical protein
MGGQKASTAPRTSTRSRSPSRTARTVLKMLLRGAEET